MYAFSLTNDGNVAVRGVLLRAGSINVTCQWPAGNSTTRLDAGQHAACTGTYRLTQGDINAGGVAHNVSLTSAVRDPSGPAGSTFATQLPMPPVTVLASPSMELQLLPALCTPPTKARECQRTREGGVRS
jgi:hypothetical protein